MIKTDKKIVVLKIGNDNIIAEIIYILSEDPEDGTPSRIILESPLVISYKGAYGGYNITPYLHFSKNSWVDIFPDDISFCVEADEIGVSIYFEMIPIHYPKNKTIH